MTTKDRSCLPAGNDGERGSLTPNPPAEERARKLVAAALVLDGERVLLTQRPAEASHPLEWELPGGKIELGESPEQALRRELLEELELEVEVGPIWDVLFHRYPDFDLLMLIYAARALLGSQPARKWAADFRWLTTSELANHPVLAADQKLVDRLVAEGVPTYHFGCGS